MNELKWVSVPTHGKMTCLMVCPMHAARSCDFVAVATWARDTHSTDQRPLPTNFRTLTHKFLPLILGIVWTKQLFLQVCVISCTKNSFPSYDLSIVCKAHFRACIIHLLVWINHFLVRFTRFLVWIIHFLVRITYFPVNNSLPC